VRGRQAFEGQDGRLHVGRKRAHVGLAGRRRRLQFLRIHGKHFKYILSLRRVNNISYNLCERAIVLQDSCQGDSGGPIWREDNGETATLLGVISRGAECGEKDQPGIAARVKTNLEWIYEQIGGEISA